MPYQGWKEEEEIENKQENTSNQTPIESLTDPETGGARNDVPFKDQPGVNHNANSHLRDSYYDVQRGNYEDARANGEAYIRQLQSLVGDRNEAAYKDMGLNKADYELGQLQNQAQEANAADYEALMRAIRGAYKRDNMPIREKYIEPGGNSVSKGEEIPWEPGSPGIAGGEAPWNAVDYAYEQTPNGYNQFSYGDDFGDPFNEHQYPFVAQNLANPLSAIPEYIANYIIPGMDHFPTQEELEQLYDTGLW